MGIMIFTHAERRVDGCWQELDVHPFQQQEKDYDLYGFLADVRNDAGVPPLAAPRGLPEDFVRKDDWFETLDGHSWVTLAELLAFDYAQTFEDCRTWVQDRAMPGVIRRGPTRVAGDGAIRTIRDLLGPAYFEDLEEMRREGVERVVFGFA